MTPSLPSKCPTGLDTQTTPLTPTKISRISYAQLTDLVARLLFQVGCRDLRVTHPTGGPGRNPRGGYDLQARVASAVTDTLVLVQIKQYSTPVPGVFVDQLRGAMLRMGAQQGLIVTTSKFAPVAIEAAKRGNHQLPLRLIDGPELLALLRKYKIGLPQRRPATDDSVACRAGMTVTLTLRPAVEDAGASSEPSRP